MPTASCSAVHMLTANAMARAFFLKILWVSRSAHGSLGCLGLSIVETVFCSVIFLWRLTGFGLPPLSFCFDMALVSGPALPPNHD
jgi:hypothetical protein